ncbi:MAG: hypothetical protein ABWY12_08200 [Burkholderiales bacterium]
MIAGGFLLIGAVLGFFFNRLQDERKAKREHHQRWDERIIDLSASVLDDADHQMLAARQIMSAMMDHDSSHSLEPIELQEVAAMEALSKHLAALALIVPKRLSPAVAIMKLRSLELHQADKAQRDMEVFALSRAASKLQDEIRQHFGL